MASSKIAAMILCCLAIILGELLTGSRWSFAQETGEVTEQTNESLDVDLQDSPQIEWYIGLILEYNSLFKSDNSEDQKEDYLANSPIELKISVNPNLVFESEILLVYEGEDDGFREFGRDLSNEGLYVDVLKLTYDKDVLSFFGGKYDPRSDLFGHAPIFFGNYTTNLDLEQRIAIGASMTTIDPSDGEFTIIGHTFFLDTSSLSNELFSGQNGNDLSHGGVGNTGKFNNFLLAIAGSLDGTDSKVGCAFGVSKQLNREDGGLDEYAWFGSLHGMVKRDDDSELELSADFLSMKNVDGEDERNSSMTVGLAHSNWPLYVGIAYSIRSVSPGENPMADRTDQIIEIVWRYGVNDFTMLEGAYQWVEEDNVEENSIGIAAIFSLN